MSILSEAQKLKRKAKAERAERKDDFLKQVASNFSSQCFIEQEHALIIVRKIYNKELSNMAVSLPKGLKWTQTMM